MPSNADYFDEFGPHTLFKHGLLQRYVKSWIQILKHQHGTLWVVDGFAGPGRDSDGKPGSPLLLAKCAASLSNDAASVKLVAIEADACRFAALAHYLQPFTERRGSVHPVAALRHGRLADHIQDILEHVGTSPVFVFIDPFGAAGLDLSVVSTILERPKAEIFALFSSSGIVRHLGAVAAEPHVVRVRRQHDLARGLFPDLDRADLDSALADAEVRGKALRTTRARAEEIITSVFGSLDAVRVIAGQPKVRWPSLLTKAYVDTLGMAGASHVTAYCVEGQTGGIKYYLVHAAKHGLATFKLKEALNAASNSSGLPPAALARMALASSAPVRGVAETVRHHFAGRRVRWTSRRFDADTVRGFALSETGLLLAQLEELKSALASLRATTKPLVYEFPTI